MKKLLALLCVFLFVSMASAAQYDGGFFTAETPDGWTEQKIDNDTGMLLAGDKSVQIIVQRVPITKGQFKEFAKGLCNEAKGKNFQPVLGEGVDDGEAYDFDATVDDLPAYVQVFLASDTVAGVISICGESSEESDDVFSSIEFKD